MSQKCKPLAFVVFVLNPPFSKGNILTCKWTKSCSLLSIPRASMERFGPLYYWKPYMLSARFSLYPAAQNSTLLCSFAVIQSIEFIQIPGELVTSEQKSQHENIWPDSYFL